ncbi:hypothetical protein UlMin_014622 [Ulmus minor]
MKKQSSQHLLVLPFPAQGHVKPLMTFSQKLAHNGFKITFVNTDFIHKRVLEAMGGDDQMGLKNNIDLVSIPDGLGPEEDRNEFGPLCDAMLETMPEKLEKLIRNINGEDDENKISCVVAEVNMGWVIEVVAKMGIKGAVVWPGSAAFFAFVFHKRKFIDDGIVGSDGFPTKKQMIKLTNDMPALETSELPWLVGKHSTSKNLGFEYVDSYIQGCKLADWWLCNTTYNLESAALSLFPKLLPIGPLNMPSQAIEHRSQAQFWVEDSSCLNWLDQQAPSSVIYVAFGSITVHDQTQFDELALGLELTGKPFLWVVRPGFTKGCLNSKYPDGFKGNLGKIVSWAPQQKVLSHPSVACFVSHCGWNSTIEGLSNGLPFLCWPYFADQFLNKRYICETWKVGMGFDSNENGIVSREELKKKVDQLLGDGDTRRRCLEMKEMVKTNIAEDGQSSRNFEDFIKWLKA